MARTGALTDHGPTRPEDRSFGDRLRRAKDKLKKATRAR